MKFGKHKSRDGIDDNVKFVEFSEPIKNIPRKTLNLIQIQRKQIERGEKRNSIHKELPRCCCWRRKQANIQRSCTEIILRSKE